MEKISLEKRILEERQSMLRFANSLLADKELAIKLVEETISKAQSTRGQYKDCTSLRGWLFTLMKQTLSHLREV